MTWTLYILLSATFLAFYDLFKKAGVSGNAVAPVLLISSFCGAVAFAAYTLCVAPQALIVDGRTLAFTAGKACIVASSWIFTFYALRTLPISVATPIRACAPALTILVAVFVFAEAPTPLQWVGIVFAFLGCFLFSWAGSHEGLDFRHNRAVWCAFAGMVLASVSSLYDKLVFQVLALPRLTVQFYFQLGLVLFYIVFFLVQRSSRLDSTRFEWRWAIPATGVMLALADYLYFAGLAQEGVLISVASLLRRFSVVITFFLGAKFFHETNMRRKTIALASILIGMILLCVK